MPERLYSTEGNKNHKGRKAEDLTGKTFGNLTVLERAGNKGGKIIWSCRCICGNTTTANSYELKNLIKKSCGCLKKESGKRLDITGRRYGKLTAICPTGRKNPQESVIWKCRCDCGNETEAAVAELNRGNKKSCGCLKEEYQQLLHDRLHLIDGTCVEWLRDRKSRSDNISGSRGVFRQRNGRYRVSVGFKKKIYYIGIFDTYEDAVQARHEAEHLVHDGFLEALRVWESKAEQDSDWAVSNPFGFDVTKEGGKLVIHNSVEEIPIMKEPGKVIHP